MKNINKNIFRLGACIGVSALTLISSGCSTPRLELGMKKIGNDHAILYPVLNFSEDPKPRLLEYK